MNKKIYVGMTADIMHPGLIHIIHEATKYGDVIVGLLTDKAIADVITLHDEVIDDEKPYTIFDPDHTWKRKTVENFTAVPLLQPIFQGGECVYTPRALKAIRAYCSAQVETLWEEVTRFENPHNYYVDLSQKLWDIKQNLLNSHDMH